MYGVPTILLRATNRPIPSHPETQDHKVLKRLALRAAIWYVSIQYWYASGAFLNVVLEQIQV